MSNLPFLNEIQYRLVLFSALAKQGISQATAEMLVEGRAPMFLLSVLEECQARGIDLGEGDVDEFIWEVYGGPPPKREDGSDIDAVSVFWDAPTIDALLQWASQKGRGKPSLTSDAIAQLLSRTDSKTEGVN